MLGRKGVRWLCCGVWSGMGNGGIEGFGACFWVWKGGCVVWVAVLRDYGFFWEVYVYCCRIEPEIICFQGRM